MAGEARIRALKNGPYEVAVADQDPIYLFCRCGRSANKPFCDGMNEKAGFQADECARMTSGR